MHTTMGCVDDARKSERGENDVAISGSVIRGSAHSTLDSRTPERAVDAVQSALEDFGVPKRSRPRKSKHDAAKCKSVAPYSRRVESRTGPARTGHDPRIENLAPDTWKPTYPATRSLSDRAPFAYALSGYDPDRVADSDYPWCVP